MPERKMFVMCQKKSDNLYERAESGILYADRIITQVESECTRCDHYAGFVLNRLFCTYEGNETNGKK